jgi:hypothetical protein
MLSLVSTRQAAGKRAAEKRTTPWGPASVLDEVRVAQQAGAKRFSTVVELLESETGERFVRIAYTTDGVARRGPVTLRPRDLERLRAAVAGRPELAAALGLEDGGA